MCKFFISSLLLILSFLLSTVNVLAEESVPTVGFQVEAQLTENQLNKGVSYFHIGVKPRDVVTLHVRLDNPTEKEVKVVPSICGAKTNVLGVVEYTTKQGEIGEMGQETIEAIATIKEKEIKLAPKESYDLKIQVKMPEKEFQGIRAGAIRLLQKDTEEQIGNVRNQFAREIGLVLESSSPDDIKSSLTLKKAEAGQLNARNVVELLIDNPKAKFCSLTEIKGVIKKKYSEEVVTKAILSQAKLAPNAEFEFPVPLAGKAFESGVYVATFTAKEGEKIWKFEREFKVTEKESNQYNQSDVQVKQIPSFVDCYWLLLLVILVVFILFFYYLIWKKSKY